MADISSGNSFTAAKLKQANNGFDVAVSGSFTGRVTVQLSKDRTNWVDADDTEAPTVMSGRPQTAWYVRAGFKTGDYTSGTATVEVY